MGALAIAWLLGEGLITWRSASELHMPPSPRQLLLASGLFVGLAVIAEYQPAKNVATAFAFAVDLAVLLQVLPGSGTSSSIKAGSASGWASIQGASNTVIIPNGTAADSSANSVSASSGGSSAAAAAGTPSGSVSSVLTQLQQQFGWSTGDVSSWEQIISAESSGNANATNSSSGAFGLAQALGHGTSGTACPQTGVNQYGGYGLTNAQAQAANCGTPGDQLLWMANYIKQTYGTPTAAWAFHLANGYY
jgi:hypothetical protein